MEATESSLPFQPRQETPVDWSDLPADLVATISKKLHHDLFDFVYFRVVCKNWRTFTSISDLPAQFPWILETQDDGHLRAYSFINGKSRTIYCPEARGKSFRGPSDGYLCAINSNSNNTIHYLLNPLTNDEMIIEFEKHFSGSINCMSPHPMRRGSYIAFADDSNPKNIGFNEPHNREWYYVVLPIAEYVGSNQSYACVKGLYCMIDNSSDNIVVADITSGSSFSIPPPDDLNKVYFVESAGKILRIAKRDNGSFSSNFNFSFDIYQLDFISKNCGYRWVKTSSIGNQILFLHWNGGISIAACETTGLRGNCIYFLNQFYEHTLQFFPEYELYWYNIEDGQTEKIPSRFNITSKWFVPCIIGSLSVDFY